MEVESHENLRIYHHKTNRGVGASTLTGFKAALKLNCDVVIKLDADGQHPPEYLLDLIPYVFSLPKYKLNLVIIYSKKINLKSECLEADIIIAAVGIPELVKGDWVKKGSIVIDVGINKTEEGIVCDVDFY